MLFLAVFAGFLAENQREHYVEHQRAKAYAFNLYNELKVDTARLVHLINFTNWVTTTMDTLCEESRVAGAPAAKLYFYSKITGSVDFFNTNCTTMEQLINSGNLRLMGSEISFSLSRYNKIIHDMEKEYALIYTEYQKINDLRLQIFDGYVLSSLSIRGNRDSIFQLDLKLLNEDPKLMKLFIGWIKLEAGYYRESSRAYLVPLLDKAKELLSLLKEKYHLI